MLGEDLAKFDYLDLDSIAELNYDSLIEMRVSKLRESGRDVSLSKIQKGLID